MNIAVGILQIIYLFMQEVGKGDDAWQYHLNS